MKKLLLPVCFGIAVFAVSCQPSKEQVKKNFLKSCTEQAANYGANISKDIFDEYCNCAADKMLDKYSVAEVKEMEKDQSAMMQKVMPVIQPCVDDLQQKVMSNMQGQMPQAADTATH